MRLLLLLFIVIPALEIGVFILAGKTIGVLSTILLIILTGILGAYLAKKQGLITYRRVKEHLRYGENPSEEIINGLCIFIGGILLLSPGFITDFIGFLLLFPPTRNRIKPMMKKLMKKWVIRRSVIIYRS